MRSWCKILPFFIIEYLSKKHGEEFTINLGYGDAKHYRQVGNPFKGVYIEKDRPLPQLKDGE